MCDQCWVTPGEIERFAEAQKAKDPEATLSALVAERRVIRQVLRLYFGDRFRDCPLPDAIGLAFELLVRAGKTV